METRRYQSFFYEATVIEKYQFLDGNTGKSEFIFWSNRNWKI